MECGLKSLNSSSPAASPSLMIACRPFPQPPLLPLPAHLEASPQQRPSWPAPAGRQADLRANKSPKKPASGAASPPIVVAAPPSAWTSMDSMYSVSPPPSSVPMPTSLLLATGAGRKKVPTPCAVQVAAEGVDVGATDELRRLLRL